MTSEQKEIYRELLDSQVLKDDIHELLKRFKEANKTDITLSGNKSDNIENLLTAVDKNIINIVEVQILIKDSEEFGDQYVFIYSTVTDRINEKYNNGDAIINSLVSTSIRSKFPNLTLTPESFQWADFRYPYRGSDKAWLLKMYDRKVREIKTDEKVDYTAGTRIVTYEKKESRLVYLVEWNESNQIEIKISRTSFDSTKSLNESLKLIRSKIYGNGFGVNVQTEIVPFDLKRCVNKLLVDSDKNSDIYKVLSTTMIDLQGGKAFFRVYDDQGENDLKSEVARKDAIEAYLNGSGKAEGIVIRFLKDGSNNELSQNINITIGRDFINQLIIPAKIKSQEYKYVRRKIAEFS